MTAFFRKAKDGGQASTVTGYWLAEIKRLFSVVLLRFDGKSREVFHNHAFNSLSWVLRGRLIETMLDGSVRIHWPSPVPFVTPRGAFHRVDSVGRSWVLSFRGPWWPFWSEYRPGEGYVVLSKGRKERPL